MNESDKVFCGNMCFVCRATVNEVKLRKCGSCKLIYYCSEEHQKIHWKRHRPLCKVVRNLLSVFSPENVKTHREWFEYRTKFLAFCKMLMKRELKPSEMNMILFPNNCQICHKIVDLKACPNCLCVNYCSESHEQTDLSLHKGVCHSFALSLEIDLYLEKNSMYPDYSFGSNHLMLNDDIATFIEANVLCQTSDSNPSMVEKALISELISCPLSLLYATRLINYRLSGNVVLHIVGCGYLETGSLKSWELLLHIVREIERLEIHFVGPDVQGVYEIDPCDAYRGKIEFRFFNLLYHEYLKSEHHLEPNLICTFNCGYHEYENTESDTWKETLPFLIRNPKVPLIFTSFTDEEAEMDGRRLLSIDETLNLKVRKNEFCSLRPYRDLEKMGVFFSNEYIGTVFQDFD